MLSRRRRFEFVIYLYYMMSHRELAGTTVLSEGETGIPILRPGVAAPQPAAPMPSYSYAQKQPAAAKNPPKSLSSPEEEADGPKETNGSSEASSPMQQINLASPPPMPSNLRNADFF